MDTNRKAKTTEAPATEATTCLCGCGAEVARRFLPGHDAKLKARLFHLTSSYKYARRGPAIRKMVELGWGGYVDAEVLAEWSAKGFHDSKGRWVRNTNINEVEWEGGFADEAGTCHGHATCPETVGAVRPTQGVEGWACPTCIRVEDLQDQVAADQLAKHTLASSKNTEEV